jgi:hypothetical protein
VKDQIKLGGNTVDTSKQKPDLMSTVCGPADGGKRILAHLEHGRSPAAKPARTAGWTIDGWTIGLCVLLLTMAGMAWMMHKKTITPDSFKPGRVGSSVPAMPAAVEHHEAPPAERSSNQAASIINDPAAGVSAERSAEPAVQKTRPAALATVASTASPRAAPVKVQARTTPTPAAAGDTDVALLAALVAHAGKPSVVAPERSRDVVERQEGDSTAQLLARCKQLGLIEGMLCRSRICSGRWDADPACRAPSH